MVIRVWWRTSSMALTWRHHTLIQSLLSRPPLPESEFYSIFSGVTGKNPCKCPDSFSSILFRVWLVELFVYFCSVDDFAATHRDLFNDFLLKINKELAYVQFELRGCRNQYDGRVYYGVVNNVADEQSKLGTRYSVPQIAFYKAVVRFLSLLISKESFFKKGEKKASWIVCIWKVFLWQGFICSSCTMALVKKNQIALMLHHIALLCSIHVFSVWCCYP